MLRSIILVLWFFTAILPVGARADYSAPASEVMLLPQFCWGQYNRTLDGPQFRINDCGWSMNHYCPSLVAYNRSFRISSRKAREQELKVVLKEVEYTLRGMKDYPACPIRGHVEKTYSRVRADLGLPPIITKSQPPATHAPATSPAANDAAIDPASKDGSAAKESSELAPASLAGGSMQSPKNDGETKVTEPEKIGSPTNPWCRFCPDPPAEKPGKQ